MEIIPRFNWGKKTLDLYRPQEGTPIYGAGRGPLDLQAPLPRPFLNYQVFYESLMPIPMLLVPELSYIRREDKGIGDSYENRYSKAPILEGKDHDEYGYVQSPLRQEFYREADRLSGPVAVSAVVLALETLLVFFSDVQTMSVARSISDMQLCLREESNHRLVANVGETNVEVNLYERTIIHHCPTWVESSRKQKFCPHIVKLFLKVNPEDATSTLSVIRSDLNRWKFLARGADNQGGRSNPLTSLNFLLK